MGWANFCGRSDASTWLEKTKWLCNYGHEDNVYLWVFQRKKRQEMQAHHRRNGQATTIGTTHLDTYV
ncbi:MAG: hypothetical protein ACRCR9_01325 [Chitinophagaceae bacterium]